MNFPTNVNSSDNDIGFLPAPEGLAVKEPQKPSVTEEPVPEDTIQFYQKNFGPINPFMAECIKMWETDIGPELVIEAMKRALKKQKLWGYAEGILKGWANRNVRSLIDVTDLDQEFASRREKNGNKVGRRSTSQAAKKREAESITGNQVGWIRRNST